MASDTASQLRRLVGLSARASERVVLVAPFIKEGVISKILDAKPAGVPVDVYTRWDPVELAAGVSDLGVWDTVQAIEGASLFLCPSLHAKCYIFDQTAIVGSGNLTGRGLGAHSNPNVEFMTVVESSIADVAELLSELANRSHLATYGEYLQIKAAVESLVDCRYTAESGELLGPADIERPWVPRTRYPEHLYIAYMGKEGDLTRASWETCRDDLRFLSIPPGLSPDGFKRLVAARMFQTRLFASVYDMSAEPRRFGHYRSWLRGELRAREIDRDASLCWQTMLRWILHFGADQYFLVTPRYSEILWRWPVSDIQKRLMGSLQRLRVDVSGETEKVYKPLLLLLLVRLAELGWPRMISFPAIEKPLGHLVNSVAAGESRPPLELPFWHLQQEGLWRIEDVEAVPLGGNGRRPTLATMRELPVVGSMPHEVWLELQSPVARSAVSGYLLTRYFDEGTRGAVLRALNAIGVDAV